MNPLTVAPVTMSLALLLAFPAQAADWGELYARLQQLEEHYGELREAPSPEGLREESLRAAMLIERARDAGPEAGPLVRELTELHTLIGRGAEPLYLWSGFRKATHLIVTSGRVTELPSQPPDVKRGEKLFQARCSMCHGERGDANTPVAATLRPPPPSLAASETLNALSPLRVFYVLTYGEPGTAMARFADLSEHERWSLAFYVFTLRPAKCQQVDRPSLTLRKLASATDSELVASFGDELLACLRQSPRAPSRAR